MKTILSKILLITCITLICFMHITSIFASTNNVQTTLNTDISALRQKLDAYIDEYGSNCPSVSIEVFQNDHTLYSKQIGFTDIENQIPVSEDTAYEWASVTKLLVWTSVMQLYEQGMIDLEADIRTYLPDRFFKKLSFDQPITMINLMNHQGGWQETVDDLMFSNPEQVPSLEESLIQTEPMQIYAPGTVTCYSNWGCGLAAYIVERITGIPFTTYVHENIFTPLGMEHTSIAPDYQDTPGVLDKRKELKGYVKEKDILKPTGTDLYYISVYPAGAATGTLKDFSTFAKAFVPSEKGGCKLFKFPETLTLLKQATSYYNNTPLPRLCHGFWSMPYGVNVLGHMGNTLCCSSTLMFDPESGLGVVILTNEQSETRFCFGILSEIFGDYSQNSYALNSPNHENKDISGYYYIAGLFDKGIHSILKSITYSAIRKSNETGVFNMGDSTLTKVADHQYILDSGEGNRYFVNETVNANGQPLLQAQAFDILKETSFKAKTNMICAGLFVLSILISFIILLIKIISWCINKILKKETMANPFITSTALQNVLTGCLLIGIVILPKATGTLNPTWTMIQCILIRLSLLITFIHLICIGVRVKVHSLKPIAICKLALMTLMTLFISFSVYYWQLWNY